MEGTHLNGNLQKILSACTITFTSIKKNAVFILINAPKVA